MKFRLKCFSFHLGLSIVIALASLYLVYFLWYPSPLDQALGVTSIFLLLLGVDVIIGPLLTMVIARQGKKTLKMDLLIIGLVQLLALGYGIYTVAQGRPVWMVYNNGRFDLVQAFEVVNTESPSAYSQSWMGPKWAELLDPLPAGTDPRDAFLSADYVRPLGGEVASRLVQFSIPLAVLKRFNNPKRVDQLLQLYPSADAFVPMLAAQKPVSVLIDKSEGKPLAIIDLAPW